MFDNIRLCSSGSPSSSPAIYPPDGLNVSGTLAGDPIPDFCLHGPKGAKWALFPTFPLLTKPIMTYTLLFIWVNPFQTCAVDLCFPKQSAGQGGAGCHKRTWRIYEEIKTFLALPEILIDWVCGRV